MDEWAIKTHGLTRRFGPRLAVDGVDLCVPAGSIYCFLGPNGAGKTTTIRMLLGLLRPTSGSVQILGLPLARQRQAVLEQTGALVEAPSLYPHLTGRENLELLRRLRGAPREQIDRALVLVGLEDAAGRLVSQYSMGMRQRLGLAMALLSSPVLLVLDEPTNGLDPAGIHEIRELIRSLPARHGVTVFVSSHLLSEVEQMATHLGIIQEGRLVFQGTPDQLRARSQDYVILGLDRPELGRQALVRQGWQVQTNGDRHLYVRANGEADAALMTAKLVGEGLAVHQVLFQQPTLEEIFLQLTGPAIGSKGASA